MPDKCLYQDSLPLAERELAHICRQDRNMASMEVAVSTIAVAVNEIKEGQKEVTSLMREIAIQGVRVDGIDKALATEIQDRKHVNDILFDRMHGLELAPSAAASNRWSGVWGGVLAAVAALIAAWVAIR